MKKLIAVLLLLPSVAFGANCAVTLPEFTATQGCTAPTADLIKYQNLADGSSLAYVPTCTHGASQDYQVKHFTKDCAVVALQVETMRGNGNITQDKDGSITCGAMKLRRDRLVCNTPDNANKYITATYRLDASTLRLDSIISTDLNDNSETIEYQRKH